MVERKFKDIADTEPLFIAAAIPVFKDGTMMEDQILGLADQLKELDVKLARIIYLLDNPI